MKLIDKLDQFAPIDASDYSRLDFIEPKETKFILNAKKLKKVFDEIKDKYYVLEIKGNRILKCTNEYYDTADYKLYMAYHNGNANRYLIKNNEIEGLKNNSLEIKFKSNKGGISKIRQKIKGVAADDIKTREFVQENTPYNMELLKKMLKNSFYRIVLIHKTSKEKITIDMDMMLSNMLDNIKLPYLAIVEVKEEKLSLFSDFILSLRKLNVQKTSLSKYCIGVALLNKDVKKNKFKSKLLAISKINDNSPYPQKFITA